MHGMPRPCSIRLIQDLEFRRRRDMGGENPRLAVSQRDGVTVVRLLVPRILDEVIINEIGERLKRIVAQAESPKIVLDFSEVTHMSSSALGVLITIHKRIREKNGRLSFAGIQPSIYEVFVITRLKEIFPIHSSVEEAVASTG